MVSQSCAGDSGLSVSRLPDLVLIHSWPMGFPLVGSPASSVALGPLGASPPPVLRSESETIDNAGLHDKSWRGWECWPSTGFVSPRSPLPHRVGFRWRSLWPCSCKPACPMLEHYKYGYFGGLSTQHVEVHLPLQESAWKCLVLRSDFIHASSDPQAEPQKACGYRFCRQRQEDLGQGEAGQSSDGRIELA